MNMRGRKGEGSRKLELGNSYGKRKVGAGEKTRARKFKGRGES